MADTNTTEIDTLIDASPADIHAAAEWLGKLKTGFEEASTSLKNTSLDRLDLTGEFGVALNDYINDICAGCDDAAEELTPTIDTIESWHDQVVWRKQDMAGHRDDAKAGELTVRDDRYIQAPESVSDPGNAPKNATVTQKNSWQTAHDNYEKYLEKKKVFDNLQNDVNATRKQLTDWVAQHMTISETSPLYELQVKAMQDGSIKIGELVIENKFYGTPFNKLVERATPAAAARAAAKSGNPQVRAGKKPPNPDSVARRAEASARAKGGSPTLTAKAKKLAQRTGTTLTLALSGWEIYNGKSPSQVGLETAAGFAAGAVVTAAAAATLPAWGTAAVVVLVGGAVSWGVGKAYESWVPLRTRERIDEGIKDAWNATVGSAWKAVFG